MTRTLASELLKRLLVMERGEATSQQQLEQLRGELERLRRENERLSTLAYRDPLTGLRNRRFFTERLGEELCRLRRRRVGTLSVIVADVNDFKTLNDTRGHAAGDAALVAVGRVLESVTRTEDIVCRVGGDEFVLMLPDTDEAQGRVVLGRVREHLTALTGVGLSNWPLALGLATWRDEDDELRLLSRADDEMYADKRGGRDEGEAPVDGPWAHAA
jgi:diguanylate cyclase (GGDEF)-like protein